MSEEKAVTVFICGGKPDHEHDNDWTWVQTFEGGIYKGPYDEVCKEVLLRGERIQTDSVCCSICGSSAYGRDVNYGFE